MITDDHVKIDRDGHLVTVTLDRPGTRNACSMNMWLAIRDAFRDIAASDARCVVLTGANGDFCSGADIVKKPGGSDPGWEGNRLTAMRQLAESVVAVHDCPVPVIAKVDGVAVGAGFGLALAADMLWCSDRARMSAVFAKLGLSLDYGSSWLLAKRLGLHRAKEVAFTAEMMSAARIDEIGLANGVVPADRLEEVVAGVARRIVDGPPIGPVHDEAHARHRRQLVADPGPRDRGDRPERQPRRVRPDRGPDGVRREARPGAPGPLTVGATP